MKLLAGLGVAIGVCGAVAVGLYLKADQPPPAPPATRDVDRLQTLVEPAANTVEPTKGPGATLVPADPTFCPEPPFDEGGTTRVGGVQVEVVLPAKYDRHHEYPLLLLLHEGGGSSSKIIEDTGFGALAKERGFIVAAPQGPPVGEHRRRFDDARATVAHMRDQFCVDEARIFAAGQAIGGNTLDRFACEASEIQAIGSHGQRWNGAQDACPRPIPNIYLAGLEDGYNPVEGGGSCSGTTAKMTLADHEDLWRGQNKCGSKRRVWREHRGSTCWTWSGCEAPFVSCHLKGGGHLWPNAKPTAAQLLERQLRNVDCVGEAADFPYAETMWDFFMEVAPPPEGSLDQ